MSLEEWLRPIVGLDDAFGLRAKQLRMLQSRLLALFNEANYEEVIPPIVERPQSLAVGAGRFLADQTVVFNDPAGAGQLAIRSDMTPQIARIAATRMRDRDVVRVCYSGPVMLARPESRSGSRQQWQTGIELIGIPGVEADIEVVHLAARALACAGFASPVLRIGHVGLIRALIEDSRMDLDQCVALLARRSPEDMLQAAHEAGLDERRVETLLTMVTGGADRTWLAKAVDFGEAFQTAAEELIGLADAVERRLAGEIAVQLDAGLTPRFLYHSGAVFAAYAANAPQALLYGGRYDAMMAAHGRDAPATGFSADLWSWLDACAAVCEG